jgi:hypothetical protein
LQAIADDYLKLRMEEIARCEQIIREKAAALFGHAHARSAGNEVPSLLRPNGAAS